MRDAGHKMGSGPGATEMIEVRATRDGYQAMQGEIVVSPTSRDDYENAATAAGIDAKTDADLLSNGYAYANGDVAMFPVENRLAFLIERPYWRILDAARRESKRRLNDAVEMPSPRPCANCGTRTRHLMISSFSGLVCPECYDGCSD